MDENTFEALANFTETPEQIERWERICRNAVWIHDDLGDLVTATAGERAALLAQIPAEELQRELERRMAQAA